MKEKIIRRCLSIVLSLMMVINMMPLNALANTIDTSETDTSEEIVEEVNVEEESKEEVTPEQGEQEVVPESGDEEVKGEETSEEDEEVTPPADEVIDVNQTPTDEQEEVTPPENPDTGDDETDNPVVEDPVENPDDTVIDDTVEGEEIPVVEEEATGENDELNSEKGADQGSVISALYGSDNIYALMTVGDELEDSYAVMTLEDGIAPLNSEEVEYPIYILAGGDFQEAGSHSNSATNVTNILAQIYQKYTSMNGFLFVGDYDCETHNDANETSTGIAALMSAVQSKYSNLNDANSVLVQGNHDYKDSRIDATGGHEFDGYSAYVLNEDDYPNGGGSQTGVQALASNLESWLNNKIGEGYDAPIFIVSHLPLAFSPRTVTQGDAKYAKYIFDVLNSAAEEGLNIIFMYGHDHAYGPDNYMGGEAIYLAEGDNIYIAEPGSTNKYTQEALNFTYMNAGYTGYYSDPFTYVTTAGTDKLTMTVFKITENDVTVERYSANGLYNLKSAGYNGSYSNTSVTSDSLGLTQNKTVYSSPQTINLNEVEDYGTIGYYVGIVEQPANDVTTSGNGWVTITAPIPGTEATPESTTYKYVLDTDGVNTGTKYLIVNTSNNGNAYVLTNDNGSVSRTQVSISDGEIIVEDETNINWIFSGSDSGTIVNQGGYLYLDRYTDLSLTNSGTNATISNQQNGAYRIYRNSSNRYNYLRYNRGAWTKSSVNNINSITSVYLFAYDSVIVTPGTEATPGTPGLYGMVEGNLTYNVNMGTSATDALAAVKTGIAIKYATASDYSDVQEFPDDGEGMTWTLDPNYDGNTPGDYAVEIAYNGTVLGTAEVVISPAPLYYLAEGNGLYIVNMNTTEANALATVKDGVTVSYSTDTNGTNKTVIEDSLVTWNWVDKYNGADSGPYTVEILYKGHTLGTVEVKVDIKYETGIETDWTYIGETEATGGKHTYTLDVDGIEYGSSNKYIIVDDNQAIVLNANSTSNGTAHSITISGNTATLDTRDYEYHMIQTSYNGRRYELITKGDGSQYLYQESNGVRYGTRSNVKFQVNHHGQGVYDIHDIDGTNWYIIYNNSWTVTETTTARVRLYKYTGTSGGTPGGSIYALIEGKTIYTVTQGSSATKALNEVKAGITGYYATDATGTGKTELADSDLTWKWKNTFNGNTIGSYWVEISYQGEVLGTVEVRVEPGVINNYPEYPDEGAVKVSKTGTGIQFQSTGVAQIEISASGVPSKKGADVIIMLDTSSSMTSHTVTGTTKTRAAVLEESLVDLIKQFKTPGDDGELLDLRVAIADFNGFYGDNHSAKGTPYDRDAEDMMSDDISYNANSEAQIYTGDHTLGAGAFIPVEDLASTYTLNYTSGTNYDYAMDAIYQLGTAIKEANGNENRDLYVIFMSDGAAMQWNYYHSQGASSLWNNWLCGNWAVNDLSLNCNTHAYYYNDVDTDGDGMMNEHRMANAIKGDPAKTYEVIRKTNTLGTPTSEENMYMVPGLGATMFSISFDAKADTNVTEETMDLSIETLASEQTGTTKYYYKVTSADELSTAFNVIGTEIAYAASNARYVDQMGDDFNLQMTPIVDLNGNPIKDADGNDMLPSIEIISYDIYTKVEADKIAEGTANDDVTEAMIGNRKGTYTVLETVTFDSVKNVDGTYTITGVYSDLISDKNGPVNILADGTKEGYIKGVIYAKTFLYNTNINSVAIDGVNIPTSTKNDGTTSGSTNLLPSETFYWKMGTVQTSELAMRYYVYLEGSMEGTRVAGSYPTNEYAILYYDNYLDNPCLKETVSPIVAWESANVSYAFYLVNEQGEIIVNQTTGQIGTFANKVAVTNPVVYREILLNNTDEVTALSVKAISGDVLPKYYELYDEAAEYEVTIKSDATGKWKITADDEKVQSTYVTQYKIDDPSAYSNDLSNESRGSDYTHTVVWFAVVWKVQAHPDTVVIDYGLPVDISVMTNDMFGDKGSLAAIGTYTEGLEEITGDEAVPNGFGINYTGDYGSAKADISTGMVRYTPNTMEMNGYDKFAYAVNYSGTDNPGYYYDIITVIPATTIYYEDNFLTYTASNTEWKNEGTTVLNQIQDEDRPGKYSLTDANNIYGYDHVNLGMSTFSLGSAKKVHVDADSYAKASFEFYGTGFDVMSMTSNTTGIFTVKVTNESGTVVEKKVVNTYYGYTKTENVDEAGNTIYKWSVSETAPNPIYQVPVLQVENLPYGKYSAEITASYFAVMDDTSPDGYDLYLDAIRIYDPANDGALEDASDKTIENAYLADGEGWPSYIELRNQIISANSFDNIANDALTTDMKGLVFIDGVANVGDEQISDYINFGPNNEIYLAPGQRVAFMLSTPENIANVHIGVKSADGNKGTYTITNIAIADSANGKVKAGDYYNARTTTIDTTTDMYYDLTGHKGDIIVISNTGNREENQTTGIISLTNIKSTYKSNPGSNVTVPVINGGASTVSVDETSNETYLYMTPAFAMLTLRSLNANSPVEEEIKVDIKPTTPEINNPEVDPDIPEVEPETPNAGTTTPETGNNNTGANAPEAPVGGPANEGNTSTDTTVESEGTGSETVVTPDHGTTEDEETVAPDTPVEETPEIEAEEQLGFFASLIKMIVDFFVSMFSWLIGLVA